MKKTNQCKYYLNNSDEFVIENYNQARPFSSFFPGIAGLFGIPMWVFYANRGQCISSFGVRDKDNPILEFYPANKAYQHTGRLGFRTFIKIKKNGKEAFYEPFQRASGNRMRVRPYELSLEESDPASGLRVKVEYFTLPNENFAALARMVEITNESSRVIPIQVLDGLPQVIPFGINNFFLKEMHRTIESWMRVENLENNAAFLRLAVDPRDRSEVVHLEEGNFFLGFSDEGGLLAPIVDPRAVFGQQGDFSSPRIYLQGDFRHPAFQLTQSITPCAFVFKKAALAAGKGIRLYSLFGHMRNIEILRQKAGAISRGSYFKRKREENKSLIESLEANCFTASSDKAFDLYCRQTFLDNCLRGGFPHSFEYDGNSTIYVYSRKHGDPERDYNRFALNPTYLSEGNGNFRDVNQNRRSDCLFNPRLGDLNLKTFFNLQQLDGYNPLVIKENIFILAEAKKSEEALKRFFKEGDIGCVLPLLEGQFNIGKFLTQIDDKGIRIKGAPEALIHFLFLNSSRVQDAEFGEGYWSDHWQYNIDLLENYLSVFPERLKYILLEDRGFSFYDTAESVQPRGARYVVKDGKVRQFHCLARHGDKKKMLAERQAEPHKVRVDFGRGEVYHTTLLVKLLTLILNKLATLDPFGVGIEMEADKPNWFDALNGLPALLGSSSCETFELKRLIVLLSGLLKGLPRDTIAGIPEELKSFMDDLTAAIESYLNSGVKTRDFDYWDRSNGIKEAFRKRTFFGVSGKEVEVGIKEVASFLESASRRIGSSLSRGFDKKRGVFFSYFINEVSRYKIEGTAVKPLEFKQSALPLFLEANVHALKVCADRGKAEALYRNIKKSPLYDRKLKMYKVCASLKGQPEELGRCVIFTPGWLENESIWLHMEYKYLLELLKAGLYEEYFRELHNTLVCFQRPEVYSRSILENSSFIVSSAFPDQSMHGAGFVARLSGSTAELINIWLVMCAGKAPFFLGKDGKLSLRFEPALEGGFFLDRAAEFELPSGKSALKLKLSRGDFAFRFLNSALVVYHNPRRKDTFGGKGARVKEIKFRDKDGAAHSIEDGYIPAPFAGQVRDGLIDRIDIILR
ncbi:MAG: hypothetical protein PHR44_01305 [Candidatus Omnitrophica bacterium]|nr:hypothetical protein [Candidatus Omnitrophota bacterium]